MTAVDPFSNVPPQNVDPFSNLTPHQRADYAFQKAAIESMRARQEASKGPTVFLPFGRQEPLRRYTGMNVIPTRKNPFVDRPEVILKEPEPGAHYGFASYDERTRGLFRAHQYEPVYEDELLENNDVPYSVSDVLTEKGPMKLVIWHGLVMFRIPADVYLREYELPALQSAARLTQHQENFNEGKLGGQEVIRRVEDGVPTYVHAAADMQVNPVLARTEMTITDVR
jgi:hypothetical protein